MTSITFIQADGTQAEVKAQNGQSLMEIAVNNGIPGIDGDCGGVCACATCHVYVDPQWVGRAGSRTPTEVDMLEMAADVEPNSRLACQISVTEELDGLIVRMPTAQY
jgi:ferredoxin, 2Fe-2S